MPRLERWDSTVPASSSIEPTPITQGTWLQAETVSREVSDPRLPAAATITAARESAQVESCTMSPGATGASAAGGSKLMFTTPKSAGCVSSAASDAVTVLVALSYAG